MFLIEDNFLLEILTLHLSVRLDYYKYIVSEA